MSDVIVTPKKKQIHRVEVKFKTEDLARIDAVAKTYGMSRAVFLRWVALTKVRDHEEG